MRREAGNWLREFLACMGEMESEGRWGSTASLRGVKTICKPGHSAGRGTDPKIEEERATDFGNPACVVVPESRGFSPWACGVEATEEGNFQAGLFHGMWNASQQR